MRNGVSRTFATLSLTMATLLWAGGVWAECDKSDRVTLPGCVEVTDGGEGEKYATVQNNCVEDVTVKVDRAGGGKDWTWKDISYGSDRSDSGRKTIRAITCCSDLSDGCDQDYSLDGVEQCELLYGQSQATKKCDEESFSVDGGKCKIFAKCEYLYKNNSGFVVKGFGYDFIWADLDSVTELHVCNGKFQVGRC